MKATAFKEMRASGKYFLRLAQEKNNEVLKLKARVAELEAAARDLLDTYREQVFPDTAEVCDAIEAFGPLLDQAIVKDTYREQG